MTGWPLFLVLTAVAEGEELGSRGSNWFSSGELRAAPEWWADIPVDDVATIEPEQVTWPHRIIAGGGLSLGERNDFEIELEWSDERLTPRKLRYSTLRSWGRLSVGADTFGWGRGILAHDGRTASHFGDPERGNVVGRLSAGTRPLAGGVGSPLLVFAAGDVVIRDENAEILLGDLASQAVLGVRWTEDRVEAGLLGLIRWQRDRLDPHHPTGEAATSVAIPMDAYFKVQLGSESAPVQMGLEGELVRIQGRTERLWNGDTGPDGGQIRSLGASAALRLEHRVTGLELDTEVAFASGDNDPYDSVSRTFFMHSDHQFGLVLFEQVLPLLTERSVERASDPGLVGQAPSGLRFTEATGGLSNAVVVHPVLIWRRGGWLELRLGWLKAQSAGDWVDVYQTARNGGYNTTQCRSGFPRLSRMGHWDSNVPLIAHWET